MSISFALITGASSGLGAEFAHQLAAKGFGVILVARSKQALAQRAAEINAEFGVPVEILVADLAEQDGLVRVCERLLDRTKPVTYLVNNAGFGVGKSLLDVSLEKQLEQVEVLYKAPLVLMRTALEQMATRSSGTIINVCSTAAFTPGGPYSALKSALLVLSKSAFIEFASRGVTVTAVCPGLTRSNFHTAMGKKEPRVPKIFWLSPQRVVQDALHGATQGKAVVIPSIPYRLLVAMTKIVPGKWITGLLAKTRDF